MDEEPRPGSETPIVDDPTPVLSRSLKWLIIAALVVTEALFDQIIEPWLRTSTGIEEVAERYMAGIEILVLGSVVWFTFGHLERLQRRVARQRRDLGELYRKAKERQVQLEALHEASVAITSGGGYPDVLERIVALAAQLGHARYGALAEFDEGERVVRFATYGVGEEVAARLGRLPTHKGLLRRLSDGGSLRLDDVRADPLFTGFPTDHPTFQTFLGVAIRWQGELLGHLYVGAHEGEAPFTEEEARLLEMFAMEAAVAIRRGRLEAEASRGIRRAERQKIAMELHDGALQSLYGVGMQLDQARRQGATTLGDSLPLDTLVDAIRHAMSAIRGVLDALDAAADSTEARLAVASTVRATARLYGVRLRWRGVGCLEALDPDKAEQLAVCLSEAVTNASRHGGATRAWIDLSRSRDGNLVVRVRDDGRGALGGTLVEGHGLRHVRRRLEAMGGHLTLSAGDGGAVTWRCEVPLGAAAQHPPGSARATTVADVRAREDS